MKEQNAFSKKPRELIRPIQPEKLKVFQAIERLPGTIEEISAMVGKSYGNTKNYISEMRSQGMSIRVQKWIPQRGTSGSPSPVFAVGFSKDAPRPVPLTPNERTHRSYYRNQEVQKLRQKLSRTECDRKLPKWFDCVKVAKDE